MSQRVVELAAYRAKLSRIKAGAKREKEGNKCDLILALADWFDLKVAEWEKKRAQYRAAADHLAATGDPGRARRQGELLADYLNHLKVFGRLLYVFQAIEVIQTEGDGWETDPRAAQAVIDLLLDELHMP